jgi:hypothetical protein
MVNHETERHTRVVDEMSNGAIDGRGLDTMTETATAASLLNPSNVGRCVRCW